MLTYNPQIKRTPPDEKRLAKKRNEEEAQRQAEVEYSLDLVPFGSVAHIPFEKIKFGEAAVRTVVIRNPSAKNVQVSKTTLIKDNYSKKRFNWLYFFQVLLEKLPKPEKGFEVDYADFVLGPKEEAQIKIGWVPQNGTPLRENVYVKFGRLKTQMVFIASCKLPQSMLKNQVSFNIPRFSF